MNRIFLVSVLMLSLCACNQEQTKTDQPDSVVKEQVELPAPNENWAMLLAQPHPQAKTYFVLPFLILNLNFDAEEGKQVSVVDKMQPLENAKLEVKQGGPDEIAFDIVFPNGLKMFSQFKKSGDVYRGNMLMQGNLSYALLQPTKLQSLAEFGEPKPLPNVQELQAAFDADEPLAAIKNFIKKHPDSSLNFVAYDRMIDLADELELDEQEIDQINQDKFKLSAVWGSRSLQNSYLESAAQLIQKRKLPELAINYIEQAKEHLSGVYTEEALVKGNEQAIDAMLKNAERIVLYNQLDGDAAEQAKQAENDLQKILDEQPYDPAVLYELAKYNAKQKQYEKALEYIAPVSAVPFLEREVLIALHDAEIINLNEEKDQKFVQLETKKIWQALHDKEDGFEDYLNESYTKWMTQFAPDEKPKKIEKQKQPKVILCELFTGATCAPCVAADIATSVVESAYDHSEVVVIRYHVHSPGKDPIANADSEQRFQFYPPSKMPQRDGSVREGYATPTLFLSGRRFEGSGGFVRHVPEIYERLNEQLDEMRGQNSPLAITLKADAKGGKLSLQASVTGLPDDSQQDAVAYTAEDLRLRLALVEKEFYFKAANGIRKHEMIVRAMPGGADGISVNEKKLAYQETIDLAEFKHGFVEYLRDIESDVNKERMDMGAAPTFKFEEKPLDLKTLQLVAFVQNDKTREILQAAIVPVSGELVFPKIDTSEKKPENKPADKPEKTEPSKNKSKAEDKKSDPNDKAKPETKTDKPKAEKSETKKPAPVKKEEAKPEAKSPPAKEKQTGQAKKSGPALVPPKKQN